MSDQDQDSARFRWPNNEPRVVTVEQMAECGMALECFGPTGDFSYREAWFVDDFGRHELHLVSDQP